MSLTSFIKIKQVREKFQETFVLPDFNYQTALLAPPLSENYMLNWLKNEAENCFGI